MQEDFRRTQSASELRVLAAIAQITPQARGFSLPALVGVSDAVPVG
jgi:hypothetical protein